MVSKMKLTDEQIAELAPEWATHCGISKKYKSIIFESESLFTILKLDSGTFIGTWPQLSEGINPNSKPIPRKSKPIPRKPEPFDITQYEWSDGGVMGCFKSGVCETLLIRSEANRFGSLELKKKDAIALAKHFGLTYEDLK